LGSLPTSLERDRLELNLQNALGTATRALTGHASDESLRVYSRARALLNPGVAVKDQISVLYGLWSVNIVRCEHSSGRDVALQSLTLAARDTDPEALAFANRMMGLTLWAAGESAEAVPLLERVVALYAPGQSNVTDLRYSQDHAVWALTTLGLALWHLGYPDQALAASTRALSWARQIGHAMTTGFAFSFGAVLNGLLAVNPTRDDALSKEALNFCVEHDLKAYIPWARFYRGLALARNELPIEGLGLMREGMAAAEQIRMKMAWSIHLGHLGFAYASIGDFEAALSILGDAIGAVDATGERVFEAELYRLKAALLFRLKRVEEAEQILIEALAIANRQKARMWELRAATMLARIWRIQGNIDNARELLRPVYGWFTEGFDTADLKEAKALLDEMD
jgi:predicted ATPase